MVCGINVALLSNIGYLLERKKALPVNFHPWSGDEKTPELEPLSLSFYVPMNV